jgi:RNA polymerase sigma-70 factor (ECF subfamily)
VTSKEAVRQVGVERSEGVGDVAADADLAAFVAEHYVRLVHLARLVCRDGVEASDAVQTGLEQAWRQRSRLRDATRLRPWLDRIVVREASRIGRARQAWLGRIFAPRPGVAWIEPIDRSDERVAAFTALRTAFAGLSVEQRAVVALHLYAGYSVAETAEIVGAPLETVRSRLRLAKDRLRRELEERGS